MCRFLQSTLEIGDGLGAFVLAVQLADDALFDIDPTSFRIAVDAAQAACTTPPQTTALGSYLEIHGFGGTSDWTFGCVAIDNTGLSAVIGS